VNRIRRFLLHRKIDRREDEDDFFPTRVIPWDKPQQIRLARKGNIGQGDLFIGRIADSTQFKDGLVLHFGHEPVPENLEATNNVIVHRNLMGDGGGNPVEGEGGWMAWMRLIKLGAECVKLGIPVLCCCDASVSRSVSSASAIVAYLEDIDMDLNTLGRELRNRSWDDYFEALPNPTFWVEAKVTLEVLRRFEAGES